MLSNHPAESAHHITEAFRKAHIIKYRGEYVLGYTISHDADSETCRIYDCDCFRQAIPEFLFRNHATTLSIGPTQCEHGGGCWMEFAPLLRNFVPMPIRSARAVPVPA